MKAKKTILAALLLAMSFSVFAQNYKSVDVSSYKDNVNGITYALPQSDVIVKFKVQKISRTKGIYQDQAYLIGVDVNKLKNSTSYVIKDVKISSKLSANNNNTYFLACDDKVEVGKTPFGTLQYIAVRNKNQKQENLLSDKQYLPIQTNKRENIQTPKINNSLQPSAIYEQNLMQQGLLNKYPQMTAEKVAGEIKRLREKQIEILSGTIEGTYMNTTVDYMYKQLDEIIKGYLALFIGVESVSEQEYVFTVTPDKPIIVEEDLTLPICKYSETEGLLDLSDKTEGKQIMIKIHSFNTTSAATNHTNEMFNNEQFKRKIEREGVGVYYTIPETVRVSIDIPSYGKVSDIIKLIQYGTVSCTLSHNSNIVFDENTGEILKIYK